MVKNRGRGRERISCKIRRSKKKGKGRSGTRRGARKGKRSVKGKAQKENKQAWQQRGVRR